MQVCIPAFKTALCRQLSKINKGDFEHPLFSMVELTGSIIASSNDFFMIFVVIIGENTQNSTSLLSLFHMFFESRSRIN